MGICCVHEHTILCDPIRHPEPPFDPADFEGFVMIGNDGFSYRSEGEEGYFRWLRTGSRIKEPGYHCGNI